MRGREPLRARLLGAPTFVWRSHPVAVRSQKLRGLLVHLALRDTPASRDELAELLWGPGKLQSVRQALYELRQLPGADVWLQAAEAIALRAKSDVAAFEACAARGDYAAALELWPNEDETLMRWQSLIPKGASAFAEWLGLERSRLCTLYGEVLLQRALELEAAGRPRAGLELIERLLATDPIHETAHRAAMRLEAALGDPEAALRRYEVCRRTLLEELGVEPLAETEALLQSILARRRSSFAHALLPTPETSFVGREDELAEAARLLHETRLLTLSGPGGIGKTRLALELSRRIAERWPDGALFVPLAALRDPELLSAHLARTIGLEVNGADPRQELLAALADKALLLVIDNLEHLLAGSDLLIDLLEHAPRLTVLATSREALGITGERVLTLSGLPPDDAAQLFVARARQANPGFGATTSELDTLVRLLGGHPLALELIAAWAGRLVLADMQDALTSASTQPPVSAEPHGSALHDELHSGLYATFELSWALLSDAERDVFRTLSVFRDGFEREAAEKVAGASLRTLLALVDKSLLRRRDDGRFEMLEVIREYAANKLPDPEGLAARHGAYFAAFAQTLAPHLEDARQISALLALERERENLRAAWRHAVSTKDVERLEQLTPSLFRYWEVRGLAHEADRALAAARAAVDGGRAPRLAARLGVRHAFFLYRLHRTDEAERLLRRNLAALRALGETRELIFGLTLCGALLFMQDAPDASAAAYREALELAEAEGDLRGAVMAHDGLGIAAFARADYPVAQRFAEQSLRGARQLGEPYWIARGLKNLGISLAVQGAYERARPLMEEAVQLCRELGDRRALASSLNNLARLVQLMDDPRRSVELLHESAEIRREIGDRWGAALAQCNLGAALHELGELQNAQAALERALEGFGALDNASGSALALSRLGFLACSRGDFETARKHFGAALEQAAEIGETTQINNALRGLAYVQARTGAAADAVKLLTLLEHEGTLERYGTEQVAAELERLRRVMPADELRAARAVGERWTLEGALEHYLNPTC